MGPSGSGKSTLLNIIGCLDRPNAGSYRLDDRETADLSEIELSRVRRHKIGFVFQFFHLVPRLTAVQNVELPMIFAGIEPRDRIRRIDTALDAVGLSERRDHRPDQLSGGERQRVAIARAIVMEPAVVLADEPTGNLDSAVGCEIIELLERMNAGGLTLLIVTHDPEVGGRSRRQVRLADGRVISDGASGARRDATGRGPDPAGDPGGRP
jgi:putative ABC transport system ATP-binding protein